MKYLVRCSGLPLAVYREVAAHLGQVDGITTELMVQKSQDFDYGLSQIDYLEIQYANHASLACRNQVEQILAYYGDRYGAWEEILLND